MPIVAVGVFMRTDCGLALPTKPVNTRMPPLSRLKTTEPSPGLSLA